MKKVLFIACLFLASCASKESNLVSKAEDFIKSGMGDPSSFSRIDGKVIDTITNKDVLHEEQMKVLTEFKNLTSKELEVYDFDKAKKEASLIEIKSNAIKIPTPQFINVHINFRAKNGFGALVKAEQTLRYSIEKKTFEVL